MATSGYSSNPLYKKLGIKTGFKMKVLGEPNEYSSWFNELPDDLSFPEDDSELKDFIHFFTKSAEELDVMFPNLKKELKKTGGFWVSWPKKQSKVEADVDGNIVRQIGLKHGLIDVKVCSLSETWSALKFMYRLSDRK